MTVSTSRMAFTMLLAAGAGLLMPIADAAAAVEVPANKAWTKTGITLKAGDAVRLEAAGAAEMSGPADTRPFYHQVPPEGRDELHSAKPQPLLRALALVAKIGDEGPVFLVGRAMTVSAGPPYGVGELMLGVNDDILDDNSGAWTVQINALDAGSENTPLPDPHRTIGERFRTQPGKTLLFEVTGVNAGSIWGSDVYTDDSELGLAAVHAGLLAVGEKGIVKVTIVAAQEKYTGSARNGVASGDYGRWDGSYRVELVKRLPK